MAGWIKVHRQLRKSLVYSNSELLHLWIHLLLKATHKDHEQLVGSQKVFLSPGQFIFGRKALAEELKLSESKVYRYIKVLENENCLEVKSNNKFSVGTIVNWEFYQSNEDEIEQQTNNKRTTNEQQMNTNKNVKNEKNEKKIKNNYAEYVLMEEEQYQKLLDEYGMSTTHDMIQRLNNYIGSKGKRYKSHYHTILTWIRKDKDKKGKSETIIKSSDTDLNSLYFNDSSFEDEENPFKSEVM